MFDREILSAIIWLIFDKYQNTGFLGFWESRLIKIYGAVKNFNPKANQIAT